MAKILVLGGGFGGVVAAEKLAKTLDPEHEITLISRSRQFVFYPALVRLAFGKCEPDDISYDLRETMLDRRISFLEAEVATVNPFERKVILAGGDVTGELGYDYLIFALGRRLATEQITGFFEHAHHLLSTDGALKFGEAIRNFHKGKALIGYCHGSRLKVPVFETAFALARLLDERHERADAEITIVSPELPSDNVNGVEIPSELKNAMETHGIEFRPDFNIAEVTSREIRTNLNERLPYDLLMLIPPFRGAPAVTGMGITDNEGYISVDRKLRVKGVERMYAVGDCTSFEGPKMGHMAVRQAEVAAMNLVDEIDGVEPETSYEHEILMVIDEGGRDSIFVHKDLWDGEGTVKQGRFWSWAKRMQERYWEFVHS